ncbi:MAG: oligosaccharide flippase family protein [Bacteroidales bacterium]|nr:oligosaccharide flippase family protein [Bacteroidales bacterium]
MRFRGAIKEAATLLSGSLVAQVVSLVAYFVLLRIYTPADFGLFTIFYSYIEVLIIASTCKYEMAVVAVDTDREAASVSRFALRLNTIVSLMLLALLIVLTIFGWLPGKFAQLGWLALLIAPMVFFCGNNRVYSALYNRCHRYRAIATSDVVGAGSGALVKTVLGLLGIHSSGLPVGAVLGQAAANINYRLGMKRLDLPDTDIAEQRCVARSQRNYPRYVAPKDFISSLSSNLPFIWLALYFDNAFVGLFGIAITFIMQPCKLISGAFERVLYARIAEAVREGRSVWHQLVNFVLSVEVVAVVVALLLWFFAEPLFSICFGGRWAGCGEYVRALLPWAVAAVGSQPLMFVPNIFGTQRTEFFIYLVQLAMRIGSIALGIIKGDFLLAVRLFAAVSAMTSLVLLVWYMMQIVRHEREVR